MIGEFNGHFDSHDTNSRRSKNVLQLFDLAQHVHGATHKNGQTLDLVITRDGEDFFRNLLI